MKAFTFLGTGVLHLSNYTFEGEESGKTQFFADAIVKFFNPDSLYIFATDSAARQPVSEENTAERLSYIRNLLKGKTKVIPVSIKEGRYETELWDIFSSVVDNINDDDTVLFDITHGFRSLPFLTFLALAYVSNVKSNVTIEKVIYGAYEAVERNNIDKPVFDLTPFVSLLNWMNAVNVFQNYGDARPIAKLEPTEDIADALTRLSDALLTNRTLEAQVAAMNFNTAISNNSQQLSNNSRQLPFQMLANQLQQSYDGMAVNTPEVNTTKKWIESLKAQYHQIKWYMKNQHYLQAITLMREWLISFECYYYRDNWLLRSTRDDAEGNLNDRYEEIQAKVLDLWFRCKIRGDLTHCGMKSSPYTATEAIEKIKELFNQFEEFYKAIDWSEFNER